MANNFPTLTALAAIRNSQATIASLKRWSCGDRDPPTCIEDIKSLHVYDFDNTLFATPLPNRHLWRSEHIGLLQSQDVFVNGGWWHDASILAATGEGVEKEESRGWAGWWNEEVVRLIQLSMKQADALTVLLTGRSESRFQDLVKRILASRKLEFDLIVLKPEAGPSNQKFASTQKFKQAFLGSLVNTYSSAKELRLYEDRIKHVYEFREFFSALNFSLEDYNSGDRVMSKRTNPLKVDVVEVAEKTTSLQPATEIAVIQKIINSHNAAFAASDRPVGKLNKPFILRRTVFFSGYLISPSETNRLLQLPTIPSRATRSDVRYLANNVMIRFGPTPENILAKAGGIGRNITWRCISIGSYEDRVWAARLEPVPANTTFYTEGQPTVVLALQGSARPFEAGRIHKWTLLPEQQQITFESTVGEKVQLRIDEEKRSSFPANKYTEQIDKSSTGGKRTASEDELPPLKTTSIPTGPSAENRRSQYGHAPPSGPKAFGGGGRGGGHARNSNNQRGNRGSGHSRAGRGGGRSKSMYYHSLDDVGESKGGSRSKGPGYDSTSDGVGLTY